jgi:hypothetical protein
LAGRLVWIFSSFRSRIALARDDEFWKARGRILSDRQQALRAREQVPVAPRGKNAARGHESGSR